MTTPYVTYFTKKTVKKKNTPKNPNPLTKNKNGAEQRNISRLFSREKGQRGGEGGGEGRGGEGRETDTRITY